MKTGTKIDRCSVAVIAAHPDDEVLGLAGTLAKHATGDDRINILFLSDGVTGRDADYDPVLRAEDIGKRKESATKVAKLFNAPPPVFLDYPNLRMDREPLLQVTKQIERYLKEWQSDIVYCHHSSDTNVDHRVAYDATMVACRPVPGLLVRSVRAFETPSSTEYSHLGLGPHFIPNLYVDVSDVQAEKWAAIACYDYEMRAFPFPRSKEYIEAKQRVRGASVGLKAAEAFMIVREIVD